MQANTRYAKATSFYVFMHIKVSPYHSLTHAALPLATILSKNNSYHQMAQANAQIIHLYISTCSQFHSMVWWKNVPLQQAVMKLTFTHIIWHKITASCHENISTYIITQNNDRVSGTHKVCTEEYSSISTEVSILLWQRRSQSSLSFIHRTCLMPRCLQRGTGTWGNRLLFGVGPF